MTSTTNAPGISIVIVSWNSGPFLERSVRSVLDNAGECELIVVDNHSEDASLSFADRLAGRIDVVRNESNLGFAAANNIGWQRSSGTLVLFLNPDAEALPGSVQNLALPLREDPAIWASAGNLVDPGGAPQAGFNIRSFPTLGSVFAEAFFLDEIAPCNPWTRKYRVADFDYGSSQDVDQPAAASLMVRRSALEGLGGFDEGYRPAWFEDVDFCKRLRSAGGRIRYVPGARFIHHGGSSLRTLGRGEFLEHFHRNQALYFARHHGEATAARVRTFAVAGLRLRAALSLVSPLLRGSGRAACAKLFWRAARRIAEIHEGVA
jgi:N-acetylglucosaminyl-diphospho-decaprenol L-rhamnosyltransferase